MKRLSLPFPTSRRQRGFFRVTALLLSAGLFSAGIITTQQVKAHQAAHAKQVLAIKKLAVKDCGCGVLVSKRHTHKLYQAAATDGNAETDNFDQAVSLKAGQRLALGVSDPTGAVQPGGTWQSDFGTVDANGTYTAPSFTPPEGLDRLHYTDPNNNDIWIDVRILPNPAISGSDQTPYVTDNYASNNAMQGGATPQAQQAQPADASDDSADAPFAPTSQTIVELPGETPAPPLQISATAPLASQTVGGASVLTLPAKDSGGDATSVIYAQPLDETPQNATLVPEVSPPSGPCTSGTTSVFGPYTTTITPENGTVNLGSIKVDSGIEANVLKVFNLKLTVGLTYNVAGKISDWKRTRPQYIYACSNKRWVLEKILHCDGEAFSMVTFPSWAILYEGYPQNNQPRPPYTTDACH